MVLPLFYELVPLVVFKTFQHQCCGKPSSWSVRKALRALFSGNLSLKTLPRKNYSEICFAGRQKPPFPKPKKIGIRPTLLSHCFSRVILCYKQLRLVPQAEWLFISFRRTGRLTEFLCLLSLEILLPCPSIPPTLPPPPLLANSSFQTASQILAQHGFLWETLTTSFTPAIAKLSNEFSSYKTLPHGVLHLSPVQPLPKPYAIGRPQRTDQVVATELLEFLHPFLDSSSSSRPITQGDTSSLFASLQLNYSIPKTKLVPLHDEADEKLLPSEKEHLCQPEPWINLYPELHENPKVLDQLTTSYCSTPLDILLEAGLLEVVPPETNVFFYSDVGNHFFYLSSVATPAEVQELSLLLALAVLLNVLLPPGDLGVRGWTLIALGVHQFSTKKNEVVEWAMVRKLDELAQDLLTSLLIGIEVMEKRTEWLISIVYGYPKVWEKQKKATELIKQAMKKAYGVPCPLTLSSSIFASVSRGTLMHCDKYDIGISPIYYLGWKLNGEVGGGVGLLEKRVIIQKNPGAVMTIPGRYWHMSVQSTHMFDMMLACFTKKFHELK